MIETVRDPSHQAIVDNTERERGGHGVVGKYIAENSYFGGTLDIALYQPPQERRKGPLIEPLVEGIEQEFVTAVSILLPTSQFIKNSKRHTLLKFTVMIGGKANNEPGNLETESLVEIFGNVRI
jgi:hypothetical protein